MLEGFEKFRNKPMQKNDKYVIPNNISTKLESYRNQDIKANRIIDNFITYDETIEVIKRESFKCYYCWKNLLYYMDIR